MSEEVAVVPVGMFWSRTRVGPAAWAALPAACEVGTGGPPEKASMGAIDLEECQDRETAPWFA